MIFTRELVPGKFFAENHLRNAKKKLVPHFKKNSYLYVL